VTTVKISELVASKSQSDEGKEF